MENLILFLILFVILFVVLLPGRLDLKIHDVVNKESKINKYGDGDCYPCINKTCA